MRKIENHELNRPSVEDYKQVQKIPLIIILDNVRSANNVGAVFRTSDAYLVKEVVLCGITARPPHKDIQKTALGATEAVAWKYEENTVNVVRELQAEGYQVFAVEQVKNSINLSGMHIQEKQPYAVVLGNEVKGVSQEVVNACDGAIELPQHGTKHSINVSVCSGIVIWEFYKQLYIEGA